MLFGAIVTLVEGMLVWIKTADLKSNLLSHLLKLHKNLRICITCFVNMDFGPLFGDDIIPTGTTQYSYCVLRLMHLNYCKKGTCYTVLKQN